MGAFMRESTQKRKANLLKKMADLDEFFIEYISNGRVELAQGTRNPGKFEGVNMAQLKESHVTVCIWDRLSQSVLAIPVKSVKSIRSLQTVMTNTLHPL